MTVEAAKLFNPNDTAAWRARIDRGVTLLPLAAPGSCGDCGRARTLRRYLALELCAECAGLRLGAAVRHLPADELRVLFERLKAAAG